MNGWIALLAAGLIEIAWASFLKSTEGFSKLLPSIFVIGSMVASFLLLSYSLRSIPIGTAYAVWTGIGACGTVLVGMLFLGESRDPLRVLCIMVIIASIAALKITSK